MSAGPLPEACKFAVSLDVACRMLLARAVIALALLSGVSADAILALALAIDEESVEGTADAELPLSSDVVVLAATALLSADDFCASLLDLRCEIFLRWRAPGLAYLLSAKGAVPDDVEFAAVSSVAACDGPARHIHNPVARINAERPLALMIILAISPFASSRKRNETPRRGQSAAKKGNLRTTPGETGAIAS